MWREGKRAEDIAKYFNLRPKSGKYKKTKSGQIQETKSGQKHAKGVENRKAETSICQNRREKYQREN